MTRSYLRSALEPFGTSVFSEMTRLAMAHGAINLAQGFPDFDGPPALLQAAAAAMQAGHNQYAPSIGVPALRQAVARFVEARDGLRYDPDTEVTITNGACEAVASAALALLEPGDEAVVVEPFYDLYPPSVAAAGGTCRFVTTEFPDFRLDPERLEAAFTPRTRLVFLNTPMNPTGRILSEEELRCVGRLAEKHDALVIADEVYEGIVFDGRRHRCVASVEGLRERTLVISSASKTFSITGWRVGWILAPAPITDAVRRAHQYVTFAAATPLQHGVAAAMEWATTTDYYAHLRAEYTERRDLLVSILEAAGFEMARPEGSFFVVVRHGGPDDDLEFCRQLTREAGVTAVPVSYFFHERRGGRDLARFAFCKRLETLRAAGERLQQRARPRG